MPTHISTPPTHATHATQATHASTPPTLARIARHFSNSSPSYLNLLGESTNALKIVCINPVAFVKVIQTLKPIICYETDVRLNGPLNLFKISGKDMTKTPNNINPFMDNNEKCSSIL